MRAFLEDRLVAYRTPVVVSVHTAAFVMGHLAAWAVRFDFSLSAEHLAALPLSLALFTVVKLLTFGAFRQYAGWWRYVALNDLLGMGKAIAFSVPATVALAYLANLRGLPRSVFLLDALITLLLLGAARVAVRLVRERLVARGLAAVARGEGVRTLLVGTGPTAESLIREVARTPSLQIDLVGLIAEDPRHAGTRIAGVPVRGALEDLQRTVSEHAVQQVIVALENGRNDLVRRVVQSCVSVDVKHRVLPATDALLQGSVAFSHIRDVSLQDLLGRPPVRLENDQIANLISGQSVAITGAGGSIGSELCRQVAAFGPSQLVLIEQSENPLFHLERELARSFPEIELVPVVCDVYEAQRIDTVIGRYRPRFLLHAAAHKHVPLMERNPSEAIKNNVIGSLNVFRAASSNGVETCVLISTDKAVNPTSVMGASKRIAELALQSVAAESGVRFAAVRFGNVLGSNGSVIPIFQEQIARGGPVTVTHPEMRRYFMTIPEASRLVLQAATFARSGELFVLDMGEPVLIVDVARDLIRLSGLEPGRDIEVVFSGIRPGEKLFEELSTDDEHTRKTEHDQIFRVELSSPAPETTLSAIDALHALARTDAHRAHVRASLFAVLGALERNESIGRIREVLDSVEAGLPAERSGEHAH